MYSDDRHIDSIRKLIAEVREYISLRFECGKYDMVSKLTVLLSVVALAAIMLAAAIVILFFLSYAVALAVAGYVGGLHVACALVALFYILVGLVIYALRNRLIVRPITNLLGHLFLNPDKNEEEKP